MALQCPHCFHNNPDDAVACGNCGGAGAAALVPPAPQDVAAEKVKEVTIRIGIEDGKICYQSMVDDRMISHSNWRAEVSPGEWIRWECPKHPFAIHFPGVTPMQKISYSGTDFIRIQVPTNPVHGCFKYFIAVFDYEGKAVLTDDPDIIIPPGQEGANNVPGVWLPSQRTF